MEYNHVDFSFDSFESKLLGNDDCGQEIDYDPEFISLENMVAVKNEQQYGNTIIPPTPIDWSKALIKALSLLGKSKDYRLCSIITRALTHKYGIKGALKGIEAIQRLTDTSWHNAYPTFYSDGETDFLPRANAIAELSSSTGLVSDLRVTEINLGVAGKITIGKIDKILSAKTDGNDTFSRDQLLKILRDEARNQNDDLLNIRQLVLYISKLELQLSDLMSNEYSPDFNHLKSLLNNVIADSDNSLEQELSEDVYSTQTEISLISGASQTNFVTNSISTRADAIKLLDKVCEFLEHNDPSNPAPLLIKRARNMIGQDFFSILGQLAPDAVAQAELVTGSQF